METACCLIIVVIFIELGGAGWEEIFKSSYGGQATSFFMSGVEPSTHQVKIFIWQLHIIDKDTNFIMKNR